MCQLLPHALAAGLLLCCDMAAADCSDEASLARVAVLHPDLEQRVHLSACSSLQRSHVVALAVPPDASAAGPLGGAWELRLLVFDADRAQVLGRRERRETLVRRGFRLQDVEIDGAVLPLAAGVEAFVVRAVWSASAGNRLHIEAVVDIYVREGSSLRRMAQGLALDALQGEDSGRCDGRSSERRASLAVSNSRSHGYADLVLDLHERHWGQRMGEQGCAPVGGPSHSRRQWLRYDGRRYVIGPPLPPS